MEQLLQLRTIPIEFEFRIHNAKIEMQSTPSSVAVTRLRGGLRMQSRAPRLQLDTYDARSSMGFKTVSDSVRESSALGMQAAYDATANFAEEGNLLLDIQNGGNPLADIAFSRGRDTMDSMLGFLPSVGVNIDWLPGDLSMQYDMDRLNFDWRINNQPDVQYIPGKLEYVVKEYPRLEITYVGKPVYVPPSADPEYVPYDTLA